VLRLLMSLITTHNAIREARANMDTLQQSTLVYPVPSQAMLSDFAGHDSAQQIPVIHGNDAPPSQEAQGRAVPGNKLAYEGSSANRTSSFLEDVAGKERTGMCLAFQDVCFNVRYKDLETKTMVDRKILKECTGIMRPGTLNAIMGASGGGKTSLLDVLADRKDSSSVTGSVLVNGKPRVKSVFMHQSGYVVQVLKIETRVQLELMIVHNE
jgi:ABC-type multidrug transport system fused ATPase/permease subunit